MFVPTFRYNFRVQILILAFLPVEHSCLYNQTFGKMEMEKVNLGYSLKNIPISSDQSYLKNMIEKLESFINRLRWKTFFFMNKNQEEESENQGSHTILKIKFHDFFMTFHDFFYEVLQQLLHFFYVILCKLCSTCVDFVEVIIF